MRSREVEKEQELEQALRQARPMLKEAQDLRKEVSSVIEEEEESEVEKLQGHRISIEEAEERENK